MMAIFNKNNPENTTTWTVKGHFDTDKGRVRKHNEDSLMLKRTGEGTIAIVADGMGGHAAGEVASRIAVQTIIKQLLGKGTLDSEKNLHKVVSMANKAILDSANTNKERRGMGCTTTLLTLRENKLTWAHVGDSRLYMRIGERLEQITTDHTVANAQEGAEEQSHVLTRAMGLYETLDIDTGTLLLDASNPYRFLLCSDGLYDMLNNEEINDILRIRSPFLATRCLIEMSNYNGGLDNVSVIVLDAVPGQYKNKDMDITKEIILPK